MNIFEKEKKMLDPKNDVIFKNLFGVSQNKDIMIDFLNKILEFEKNPIVDLSYINTEIVPVKADKSLIGNMKKNNNEETNQSNEEKEVNDKEENSELYGKIKMIISFFYQKIVNANRLTIFFRFLLFILTISLNLEVIKIKIKFKSLLHIVDYYFLILLNDFC